MLPFFTTMLMNAERTNSTEKRERWKPGMIVALTRENTQCHFNDSGTAVVSCWDRPWDRHGHIRVCELPLGTFVLVLSVSAEGDAKPSALVLTWTGAHAFMLAYSVDLTGGARPWMETCA
jgi:hypothetical protein